MTLEPEWIEHGRVPCLDGLRAVSILLVLLEHASLSHGFPLSPNFHVGTLGHIGVSMFFTISGFLITMLLVREWKRTGTVSLRAFYRRRALRILPAYIMLLLAVYVLTRLEHLSLTRTDWIGVLTYTVNFIKNPTWEIGHVWSLSVEEQFYVIWPFVVLMVSPRRALWVVLAYLAAAPLARVAIWAFLRTDLQLIEELTPLRLDAIAAGCLLGLLTGSEHFRARVRQTGSAAMWATAAAACAIIACAIIGREVTAFDLTIRYTVEAVAMATIIWSVASAPKTAVGRFLDTRPLVLIGVLSYSLYLWQQLFLNPLSTHWSARWPANLILVVCAALASYYVVESPFVRVKDRKLVEAPRRDREIAQAAPQSIQPLG